MKVPTTFMPEKNLDNKTEQLLQEKNTLKPKPIKIEQQELEEVLRMFDNCLDSETIDGILQKKIDDLIRKSDYQPLKVKGSSWEYWYKPVVQSFDESHVLVRSSDKYGYKHYAFARVDDSKLESFCKIFERYETGILSGINYNKPYFQIGLITGAIAGSMPLFINTALISTAACFIPLIGFLGGMFSGTWLARYKHTKDGAKLVRCYKELKTQSRNAIKRAFE